MLIKGIIPSTEPLIRVGIVLPEDKRESLIIDFPQPSLYTVNPSSSHKTAKSLIVNVVNGELAFERYSVHKIHVQRVSPTGSLENPLVVHDVVAGREFHWKKNIPVSLLGDLEIRVHDGHLVVINELPLEQYLMCVATSEMSAECPPALIESQTIAARAWMLANIEQKHRYLGFDVCNDDCCQRYHGTGNLTPQSIEGALSTRGKVIMHENTICDARYSKSCGGMMETFDTLWDGPSLPYMQNIFDAGSNFEWTEMPLSDEENLRKWVNANPNCFCSPSIVPEDTLKQYIGGVDEEGQYFRWQFEYTQEELLTILNEKLEIEAIAIVDILPLNRGGSGRLNKVELVFLIEGDVRTSIIVDSEYNIRQTFHKSFLYSSAFTVQKMETENNIPGKFVLRGAGWGHGAGLCQIGALGMAIKGYATETILNHYYPGSRLVTIYS